MFRCFVLTISPWYLIGVLAAIGALPSSIGEYLLILPLTSLLFGRGIHHWCRWRRWRWWMELLLVPLGIIGWFIIRLDIPIQLELGGVSLYQLNMLNGISVICVNGFCIDEKRGFFTALVELLLVFPTVLAWQYTMARVLR